MATVFKTFLGNDVTTTRTLLHESIPITGSIISGTYLDGDAETNIKNYSHGMFQSVYDYPHLSSSANHLFDITLGFPAGSSLSSSIDNLTGSDVRPQQAKKIQIYNQMAQILAGHDIEGSIREFDRDGDYSTGTKMQSLFFINFSRLLVKDEIKKGSFSINFMTGGTIAARGDNLILQDHGAESAYKVNSPAGEYGLLYSASADAGVSDKAFGHIYYQAGIAAITSSLFRSPGNREETTREAGKSSAKSGPGAHLEDGVFGFLPGGTIRDDSHVEAVITGSAISASCGGLRNAINNIQFNNTTELNSTIYFCRAGHNEFNYSANPTYVTGSKIRVKETGLDTPVSYITGIGLYSADNELLAVAKLSEPIKKTPENELTFRVRLDY